MPILTYNPNYAKAKHFKFKVVMSFGIVFLKGDDDLAEFLKLCKDSPAKVEELDTPLDLVV